MYQSLPENVLVRSRGTKLKRLLRRGCIISGGVGKTLPKRENLVSERRVDLSFSTSMRVNERIESSRKLFNELGGRFFIIV